MTIDQSTLLDDRYRLDEHIGAGGTADVWRATDQLLNRQVAIKVLREVSEPTQVNGITAFNVKRTLSRVELKEGESLIIGGLLDRRIFKDLAKFPILGDIPILGTLFRSTSFRNQESELIFVITPRIVSAFKPGEKPKVPTLDDKFDDPDMRQVPVPGGSEPTKRGPGATIP